MFVHKNIVFPDINSEETDGMRWYSVNGKKYASVTTVLSAKKNVELEKWREAVGEKRAEEIKIDASERGTKVHALVERYLNNEKDILVGVETRYKNLFNGIKIFLNKINNIHGLEVPLYSNILKIAGRADCIAEYKGKLSLIDFKTATNDKDESMILNYFMQCTAYSLMYYELFDVKIENMVILISSENGSFPQVFQRNPKNFTRKLAYRVKDFYSNLNSK